jgi:hypothetical protein
MTWQGKVMAHNEESNVTDILPTDEPEVTFPQYVWDVLSRIDATKHADQLPKTKGRPAISYLAWHTAWMLTKREFPASTYAHKKDIHHVDGSIEVEVDVVISDGIQNVYANARLGVMDNFFKAIGEPNARQINDSRQRCLVKALAFAGLGLNLWSDSNIPVGRLQDPISAKQLKLLKEQIKRTGTDLEFFLDWADVKSIDAVHREDYDDAMNMLKSRPDAK